MEEENIQENTEEKTVDNSEKQQVVGVPFTKDDPRINKGGRPPETEEQKIIKKATKQFIQEYKEKLAEALPLIEPKLVEKAIAGDIQCIKELHDRVMGKARETIGLDGGEEGKAIVTILKYAKPDKQPEPIPDTTATPLPTEKLPDSTMGGI